MNIDDINLAMKCAFKTSFNSEDPSTKVGAAIIKDNKILSVGYNRPPHNWEGEFIWNKDVSKGIENTKYPYVIHAEMDAIMNYKGKLGDLKDACMCVTLCPCENCAKLISASGIKTVVYYSDRDAVEIRCAKRLLKNCGIKCISMGDIAACNYSFVREAVVETIEDKRLKLAK